MKIPTARESVENALRVLEEKKKRLEAIADPAVLETRSKTGREALEGMWRDYLIALDKHNQRLQIIEEAERKHAKEMTVSEFRKALAEAFRSWSIDEQKKFMAELQAIQDKTAKPVQRVAAVP